MGDTTAIFDALDIVLEAHFRWMWITCGVSREDIRGSVLDAGDVYHFEVVSESFFLEVAQSSVGDVIHGSVTEDLQEGFMVHCDS